MSDDRFSPDSTVFNKAEEKTEDKPANMTLESALRDAIGKCAVEHVTILIQLLPEASREHYRNIWREELKKKKAEV